MRTALVVLLVTAALGFVIACDLGCAPHLYTHGVLNLHEVGPRLLRSGEPTAEGWHYLVSSQHVCAVVQLDYEDERPFGVKPPPELPVVAMSMPPNDLDDVESGPTPIQAMAVVYAIQALLAKYPAECRILWNCKNGWDRTGLIAAMVRHTVQGWTKTQAWSEARKLGFHPFWRGLVATWNAIP